MRMICVIGLSACLIQAWLCAEERYSAWTEAERALSDPACAQAGAVKRTDDKASGREHITVGGPTTDFVSYVFDVPRDLPDAVLTVRYSCSGYYTYFKLGRLLKVWRMAMDGRPVAPLVLPPTHPQDHEGPPVWGYTSVSLGRLAQGRHVLTLRPQHDPWRHNFALDALCLHDGPARFSNDLSAEGRLAPPSFAPPAAEAAAKPIDALPISDDDVFVDLSSSGWRLQRDPEGTGEANHWHEPAFADARWTVGDLKQTWAGYGLKDYEGFAWYRRWIYIPETWRGKDVRLCISRINQYGWVYINGQLAHVSWEGYSGGACIVSGGVGGVGSKDVAAHLRFGEPNLIAVKVWGTKWGGIWGPPTVLYASEPFEDKDGFFHLPRPAPDRAYGVVLGYHTDALLWPKGYVTRVLAKGGQSAWPAQALDEMPIPRHLFNRASPVCVAPKPAIDKLLASGVETLDADALSPFAMRADAPQIKTIRAAYPGGAGCFDVTLIPKGPFQRSDDDPYDFDLLGAKPIDEKLLPTHLHGKQRKDHGKPPVFQVDFPVEGEFTVHVDKVGVDARLEITIDGRPAAAWDLPAQGQPDSRLDPKWKIWNCTYDRDFSAPVPAGRHAIGVTNSSDSNSWIRVSEYRLSKYARDDFFGLAMGRIGRCRTLEVAIDVEADYANPYDPEDVSLCAYFTAPSGRIERVWAFFYQDFRMGDGKDAQALAPCKGPVWKLRYTPSEVGQYSYIVCLDDGHGLARSTERRFTCEPSDAKGFIRISPKDPRYLAHDDGSQFFILGVSGWLPQSLAEIDKQFELQQQNSENYAFFPTFQWGEVRTQPLVYSQFALWRMDWILKSAEKHGLYLQFFDDEMRRGPFADKAFDQANGGPCDSVEMVYTNATARAMSRNLVRQIASRYAHSPNFLLYGFGDEVSFRRPEPLMFTWIQEMVTEFRDADLYRHITIIGEGKESIGKGSDMVDLGGWYVPARDIPNGIGVDIAAYVESQIAPFREMRMAVFSSEGGLCEIGPALGKSSDQYLGPNGEMIHLHNQIWASFMLGFCGAGTEWVSTQVAKFGQHYHHKAFAAYIAGEPLPDLGLEPIKPQVSNERLRCSV
ncbi:MAG: DUF5060 domain-containing protein [Planctomycetota bacterium]